MCSVVCAGWVSVLPQSDLVYDLGDPNFSSMFYHAHTLLMFLGGGGASLPYSFQLQSWKPRFATKVHFPEAGWMSPPWRRAW